MALSNIGPYAIRGELARGGMGVVYRAFDPHLNRDVAIKVLTSATSADEAGVLRFQEEARATARLNHPNIVGLHSAGSTHGQPYLVMDLIEGRSLHERIKLEGRLDPVEAAHIARALATALQYAHDQGVLHRDVKPQNVLLDPGGRPCLTDFGVARLLERDERITRTGEVVGTPHYIAPEQAAGKPDKIGPRSDVYSLGATLFEMLTGEPPFRGESALETLTAVVSLPPRRPSELRPELDAQIEEITLRCLAKEPDERYASAGELAETLADYIENPPQPADGRLSPLLTALGGFVLGAALFLPLGYAIAPRDGRVATPAPGSNVADPLAAELALGHHFLLRADPDAAAECFRRAADRAPDDARAVASLACARVAQRRLDVTEALVARALRLDPESALAYTAKGTLLLRRGDMVAARAAYERAVALDPDDPHALNGLGSLLARSSPEQGMPRFTRALNADPGHLTARLNRARVRAEMGDLDGALVDVNEVLRRFPQDPGARYVQGAILFRQGRRDEAYRAYRRVLELDPAHVDARLRCAEHLVTTGRLQEAIPEYEAAASLDTKRPWRILSDRGRLKLRLNDKVGAERDFTTAIRLNPKYAQAYVNRGNVHGMLGRRDAAVRDYEAALGIDPNNILARLNRAMDRAQQGDSTRALKDADEILKIDRDHPHTLRFRARLLKQANQPEAALKDLDHLIKLRGDKAGAKAFILRGQVHIMRRNPVAALADLRKAERLLPPGSPDLERVRLVIGQLRGR